MGLFTPPPTNGSSYPSIPVPDFVGAATQAAQGATQSSFWDDLVTKLRHSAWEGIKYGVTFSVGAMDAILSLMVELITAAQGTKTSGFYTMVAAVLGDLLGIDFDEQAFIDAWQKHGYLKSMTFIGGKVFDTLLQEFSSSLPGGAIAPSSNPAKSFLGFLTSFAVRQGNVAFVSELLPEEFNFMGGLREYGETLARNLGLGRLARRALQPLVQVLIAEPLTWALNQQYRPKMLAEGQIIKAFLRGDIGRDTVDLWLGWLGYSEDKIALAIADAMRLWHPRELLELQRLGMMDDNTAIGQLMLGGVDQGNAQQLWTATKGEADQAIVRHYLADQLKQFENGFISWDAARAAITAAPLTEGEKLWYYAILGDRGGKYWRHLSESELERAFLGGIIDMTTIQEAWVSLGYGPGSIQVLTLLLLAKQSSGNRGKGGHVPHKHLTEAQLEKAYKSGIIDIAQIQAGWTSLGYSPDDILVLSALVEIKTAPPGTTQFPSMTVP